MFAVAEKKVLQRRRVPMLTCGAMQRGENPRSRMLEILLRGVSMRLAQKV